MIDNSIKYSARETEIKISIVPYELFVRIDIRDQGVGIEEKEINLIFKRFYRSYNTSKEEGVGIGLYLTREIIEKQSGYIKVKSEPGNGSLFSLFLPL